MTKTYLRIYLFSPEYGGWWISLSHTVKLSDAIETDSLRGGSDDKDGLR